MSNVTRRKFLKTTMAVGAMGFARVGTGQRPFSKPRGANDDIRIGVVGIGSNVKIGGKGKQEIRDFLKIPGVRVVALCDPDQNHLYGEVKKFKGRNESVDAYTDVRKLLEDPNIDAVNVVTPNHWHALVSIWACQAGKDVFVQKPASHNIFEGRKMVEAAEKYGRIVQSAAGPRSRTGIGEVFDYIRQGHLGKILYAHGINYKPRTSIGKVTQPTPVPATLDYNLWSGPAPLAPVNREYLHYDWHWDWLYGNGDLGNMGIHYMDACRWALGHDALPERVLSVGGRFGYEDDGQTANTHIGFFDYKPAPLIFEVRGLPRDKSLMKKAWNSKAMDTYRGQSIGVVIHCEQGYTSMNAAYDNDGSLIKKFEPTNDDLKVNFIKAVRSRKAGDLRTDILQGHLSASLVHMMNISHRVGTERPSEQVKDIVQSEKSFAGAFDRMLTHLDANGIELKKKPLTLGPWLTMNPKTERFEGSFSKEANKLAVGTYRQPFVVPEVV